MSGVLLDASAVVAMLEDEAEGARLRLAFVRSSPRWIGAVGALECAIVLERRRGPLGRAALDAFVEQFGVRVMPFDESQLREAQATWRRFGKSRHPAGLNLGDCCAYAAARALGLPLLQKGDDFRQTDLELVAW